MAKLSDKLSKVDEDITLTRADNGFVVTATGRDDEDDWASVKLVCTTLDEVIALIEESTTMERT